MLSKETTKKISSLGHLAMAAKELEEKLGEPGVQERFAGNAFLLMGRHRLSIQRLATRSNCSQSTMSRLLSGKGVFKKNIPTYICEHCLCVGG